MTLHRSIPVGVAVVVAALSACGGANADGFAAAGSTTVAEAEATGIRVVSPREAAVTIGAAPDDLVILDVRTQDEYDDGHIEGAVLIDFYRDDFAEQLAALDADVPYVLYCRSGNRSGRARAIMDDFGFASVADIDGGIVSWQGAGLPVVGG